MSEFHRDFNNAERYQDIKTEINFQGNPLHGMTMGTFEGTLRYYESLCLSYKLHHLLSWQVPFTAVIDTKDGIEINCKYGSDGRTHATRIAFDEHEINGFFERTREYTISILQSQLDASRMKWLKDNARREAAAEQLNPANGE